MRAEKKEVDVQKFFTVIRWTMMIPVALTCAAILFGLLGQWQGPATPFAEMSAVHVPLCFAMITFVLVGAWVATHRVVAATLLSVLASGFCVWMLLCTQSGSAPADPAQMGLRLAAAFLGITVGFAASYFALPHRVCAARS